MLANVLSETREQRYTVVDTTALNNSNNSNDVINFKLLMQCAVGRASDCDSQVVGLNRGWAPLRSGLCKLLTPVCLCHQAV